ncbi:Type II secretion system protein I [Burkholderiales bacterium]|nr:Type II secretion system protein I [Burkholderiales bacterium]
MRRVAAQKGFSLLEVLVAFVILALVATALFRLFGGALGNAGIAEDASRAVLVAQSRLDAARASPRPGSDSGVEEGGRIAWSTRVEAWTSPDAPQAGNPAQLSATQLYRVSVEVRYPGAGDRERTLALSTLRLARREGTP